MRVFLRPGWEIRNSGKSACVQMYVTLKFEDFGFVYVVLDVLVDVGLSG